MNRWMIVGIVCFLLLCSNLFCFFLMKYDKHCAKTGRWRVRESSLFLAAACFGALGGVAAMHRFRHKTKHWYFRFFFPAMLLIQSVLLGAGLFILLTR